MVLHISQVSAIQHNSAPPIFKRLHPTPSYTYHQKGLQHNSAPPLSKDSIIVIPIPTIKGFQYNIAPPIPKELILLLPTPTFKGFQYNIGPPIAKDYILLLPISSTKGLHAIGTPDLLFSYINHNQRTHQLLPQQYSSQECNSYYSNSTFCHPDFHLKQQPILLSHLRPTATSRTTSTPLLPTLDSVPTEATIGRPTQPQLPLAIIQLSTAPPAFKATPTEYTVFLQSYNSNLPSQPIQSSCQSSFQLQE